MSEVTRTNSPAALDARVRRAAKRAGLIACRARGGLSIDNWRGYMLVDPYFNRIEPGEKFSMSAEEVIAYCADE